MARIEAKANQARMGAYMARLAKAARSPLVREAMRLLADDPTPREVHGFLCPDTCQGGICSDDCSISEVRVRAYNDAADIIDAMERGVRVE